MKRVPELHGLSDDHHNGLVLARRCREAGREDSETSPELVWKHAQETFAIQLDPHFKIEEQHLLPGLEAIGEASLANRIREDHSALRALQRVEPVNRLLLKRFGELLEAHIRYEEREVFETTQHLISADVLEAIASACHALPRVCSTSLES